MFFLQRLFGSRLMLIPMDLPLISPISTASLQRYNPTNCYAGPQVIGWHAGCDRSISAIRFLGAPIPTAQKCWLVTHCTYCPSRYLRLYVNGNVTSFSTRKSSAIVVRYYQLHESGVVVHSCPICRYLIQSLPSTMLYKCDFDQALHDSWNSPNRTDFHPSVWVITTLSRFNRLF